MKAGHFQTQEKMVKEENFMLVSEVPAVEVTEVATEEVPAVGASEKISEEAVEAENTMTSKKVKKEEDQMIEKEDHIMMRKEDLMMQIDLEEEVVIEAVEMVKEK
jgi:hypothetical protein